MKILGAVLAGLILLWAIFVYVFSGLQAAGSIAFWIVLSLLLLGIAFGKDVAGAIRIDGRHGFGAIVLWLARIVCGAVALAATGYCLLTFYVVVKTAGSIAEIGIRASWVVGADAVLVATFGLVAIIFGHFAITGRFGRAERVRSHAAN